MSFFQRKRKNDVAAKHPISSNKKRQTRLNFTPFIDSSSPVHHSEQQPPPLSPQSPSLIVPNHVDTPSRRSDLITSSLTSLNFSDDGPIRSPGRRKAKQFLLVSSDSDSDLIIVPSVQSQSQKKKAGGQRLGDNRELTTSIKKVEEESTSGPRRGRSAAIKALRLSTSEDEDEPPIAPSRRRNRERCHQESRASVAVAAVDSDDELKSDYELAQQTEIVKSRTRYAGGIGKKENTFQKALEALKAKRDAKGGLGTAAPQSPSESYEGEDEDEDGDSNVEDHSEPDNNGSDLEGFIVEDGPEDILGIPDNTEIPLKFTAAAHQSTRESFKTFCAWIIHHQLFPDLFPLNATIQNSLRRLDQKRGGFTSSVVESGAWTPRFVRALKARPEMETSIFPPTNHCDACNRKYRSAIHQVKFYGRRYNDRTLTDLSSDEDAESEDSVGRKFPDKSESFTLGSNCYTRTRSAHLLIHWKKVLKDDIMAILMAEGYLDDDGKIFDRRVQRINNEEKRVWAVGISESMGEEIVKLYADYKNTTSGIRRGMRHGELRLSKNMI